MDFITQWLTLKHDSQQPKKSTSRLGKTKSKHKQSHPHRQAHSAHVTYDYHHLSSAEMSFELFQLLDVTARSVVGQSDFTVDALITSA